MAKSTLDLHGYRIEEVDPKLDRFILDAVSADLEKVRIVTGKGTGKVKAQVMQYLKQAHYQWKYERLANGKENEGVLVVYL